MIRKIIEIDAEKCTGCGSCAEACHEKAIAIVDGKARLVRDDYCDGFGNCLPVCPAQAITFAEREAEAVECNKTADRQRSSCEHQRPLLINWPIQIKLVPVNSPYFRDADLLIAADCAAYACTDFHDRFMKDKIILIGCPKLDSMDYSEKLTQIIAGNNINSVTALRMEVPCCGGIAYAVSTALKDSGKVLPSRFITLSIDGEVVE